jgi:hypothetical protein
MEPLSKERADVPGERLQVRVVRAAAMEPLSKERADGSVLDPRNPKEIAAMEPLSKERADERPEDRLLVRVLAAMEPLSKERADESLWIREARQHVPQWSRSRKSGLTSMARPRACCWMTAAMEPLSKERADAVHGSRTSLPDLGVGAASPGEMDRNGPSCPVLRSMKNVTDASLTWVYNEVRLSYVGLIRQRRQRQGRNGAALERAG